jgi:hypothetical protein
VSKEIYWARKRLEKLRIITKVAKKPPLEKTIFLKMLNIRQKLKGMWTEEILKEAYFYSRKAIEKGYYPKTNPVVASLSILGNCLTILTSESVAKVSEKLSKVITELSSYEKPRKKIIQSIYRYRARFDLSEIIKSEN